MYPILYAGISSWHFCFVLAACIAYGLLLRIATVQRQHAERMFFVLYFGGYFGARLYSILLEENIHDSGLVLSSLVSIGAMSYYGGFLAAFALGWLYIAVY